MKYIIVFDTETAPLDKDEKGVTPANMAVYDKGWCVTNTKGEIVKTQSFINKDIFTMENLMNSAYYANKIPQYLADIENGSRVLATLSEIRSAFLADCAEYGVTEIYAHNARFDVGALNNTQRFETCSKYRYYFPKNLVICDSLKMARSVIATMPTYKKFCAENGYMTKNNQVRLTAEILYRFISKDNNFIEAHTGLEDVMIEKEIVAYCYRQHKAMKKRLYEN